MLVLFECSGECLYVPRRCDGGHVPVLLGLQLPGVHVQGYSLGFGGIAGTIARTSPDSTVILKGRRSTLSRLTKFGGVTVTRPNWSGRSPLAVSAWFGQQPGTLTQLSGIFPVTTEPSRFTTAPSLL
jgi:hypothetical protein